MNIRTGRVGVVLGLMILLAGGAACSRRENAVWYTDLEEGLVAARLLKKDALVFFSCTGWPGKPGELSREVLADRTLQEHVSRNCVLINIEIPKVLAPSPTLSQGDIDRIRKIIGVFRLTTMPVFYLTDSNGLPFGREIYQPGRGPLFLKAYDLMQQRKDTIAALYHKARSANGLERARMLDEAVERMPTDILVFHRFYIREIVTLDAENKAGLRNKYTTRFMLFEAGDELERRNPDAALKIVERILTELKPTGELCQAAFFLQSRAFAAKQNPIGMFDALMRAREVAPETEAARSVARMLAESSKPGSFSALELIQPMLQLMPPAGQTAPPDTGAPPPKAP